MFLSLEIKNSLGWQKVILPPDASLHIEDVNPLFDIEAGGAFSYPFTIPVEANQHLFSTITNHHGARVYDLIYHKPFRLSGGGYPLLYGIIDLDDEVEVEEQDNGSHTVTVNLASNNQELSKLLDRVNAQDVPLKDRIPVGTEFHYLDFDMSVEYSPQSVIPTWTQFYAQYRMPIPEHIFSTPKYKASLDGTGAWQSSINVQAPYPSKQYCNAKVAIQAREKQPDGTYKTLRKYEIFDADRPNSGLCFYVQYFLDCLFANLNVAWDNSLLMAFDDFNRLSFFSTKCECDSISTAYTLTHAQLRHLLPDIDLKYIYASLNPFHHDTTRNGHISFTANAWTKYANSKNFPDTDAINIVKELQNAFGIRFIYDSEGQHCKAVFIKDVFNDTTAVKSGAIIHSAYHTDKDLRGVKMTYGGNEDDTSYNYDPTKEKPSSPVIIRNGYANIKSEQGAYDRNTYYDNVTGNWYRIKVDEDAKTEEELYPSLFEVGQFQDAWVGDITDEDKTKEVTVGFTPIICNIVGDVEEKDVQTEQTRKRTRVGNRRQPNNSSDCQYAVFLDLEIDDAQTMKLTESYSNVRWATEDGRHTLTIWQYSTFGVSFIGRYGFSSEYMEQRYTEARKAGWVRGNERKKFLVRYDEDPLSTYDAGFSLGVMRGPGNDAGVDIVRDNYDGNGNAQWAYTPTGYSYTSDSIDHYGTVFDYNGEAQGGQDTESKFSLKLRAEKVCNFQGKKVADGEVLVRTKEEAAYWLAYLFPDSNQNLLTLRPQKKSVVAAKGWDVTGFPDIIYVYPYISDGKMLNALQDNGTVLTQTELDAYTQHLPSRSQSTSSEGRRTDPKNILIKEDAVPADRANLLALANIYYFPDTAEPYTLTNIPATATTDYYPIAAQHAHRGLLHKFNYEYFQFLIHSRSIVLEMSMTLQEIRSLDKLRWHTFGQYTGLIERLEYDLDNQTGLSHVTLTLQYL